MFHHLPPDEKGKTTRAVRCVPKSGGGSQMLDFEDPERGSNNVLARLLPANFFLVMASLVHSGGPTLRQTSALVTEWSQNSGHLTG